MIRAFLAVGLGGAAGSMTRYGLSCSLPAGSGFPLTTFAVNAAGSLLIGLFASSLEGHPMLLRLLGVGFCGGFTTFSTFSADTVRLLRDGQCSQAVLYAGMSVAVCVAFAALGLWIGQIWKN